LFSIHSLNIISADTSKPETYCTAQPCSNNGTCQFDTNHRLPICVDIFFNCFFSIEKPFSTNLTIFNCLKICPRAFTGRFCENGVSTKSKKQDNLYNPTSRLLSSMRSFESPLNGYINPCGVFADLCKNGGLCSPLSTGKGLLVFIRNILFGCV
jgi:hypothetical protein